MTVRSLLSYHMRRLANPDNLVTPADSYLSPRRMAGRGPRCGPARVTPLGGGHRTAAYGGRGVQLRYLLTTPVMGWRSTAEAAPAAGRAPRHQQGPGPKERPHWWRTRRGRSYNMRMLPAAGWRSTAWRSRQGAGRRGAGAGRSRRSGTGGEPGAGAATRCTPRRRWRRTRADAAAVPVRTGAGAAAAVEDRGRWTSR